MGDLWRHVVVSAPSQWGQQACDHLLHRAVANGGRVTLIVPRRDQARFETIPPTFKEWRGLPSLERCLEEKRASGRPIDFVYDDQCNHLAAMLISQRSSGSHLTVGYVTSSSDEHLNQAKYLSGFCDRVLVEKPVSRVFSEIAPEGGFPTLAESLNPGVSDATCHLRTADHYLFRPGVKDASASLQSFVERHRECELHYQFCFQEPAGRDDPEHRLGAYQDGSILDILAPHGLGPVAGLLLPMLNIDPEQIDFYTNLRWSHVGTWQAAAYRSGPLKVPVLAETAAELHGSLRLPNDRALKFRLCSAKGCLNYTRFFKLHCATCNRPQGTPRNRSLNSPAKGDHEDEPPYIGVSLGSAGFTVFDPDQPFLEKYGGFMSDSRGSISEAANAQAAMLDALLGEEEEFKEDKRFIRVKTACEITRAGLRAQGIAWGRRHKLYTWGEGRKKRDKNPEKLPPGDPSMDAEARPRLHVSPGLKQLQEVLGLGPTPGSRQEPFHRIVTILGSEGTGNSDVARALTALLDARRIDLPRDEDWEQSTCSIPSPVPPSRFTLEMVLRKLAEHLHLPLTTARRPVEELPVYLDRAKPKGEDILLFNGVDRLKDGDWQALVRILNQLDTGFRLIFVTKKWNRAAGFVVRTEELMGTLPALAALKAPPPATYLGRAERLQAVEDYERLNEMLIRFSKGNVTVLQQIASYVFYIAQPAALKKVGVEESRRETWELTPLERTAVHELIEDEIYALDLPTPLTANPEQFLDRVSRLSLAMVGAAQRDAVRSLAAISGAIPRALIEEVLPGLYNNLLERQPVRALFEAVDDPKAVGDPAALLFPRVRNAVLTCGPEDLARLRAEIERRRLLLSLRRVRQSAGAAKWRDLEEQMIRLFYGASLESLNLDGSPFEAWCMERIGDLETSSDLHGDQAAGSLIELLTDESSRRKTNLGLLARARLTRLQGWLMRSAAGTDPARLHEVGKVLDHAVALAQYCAQRERRGEETRQDRQQDKQRVRDTLVLTLQGRIFAGLVQNSCWHRLIGLGAALPVARQPWEDFVTPPSRSAGSPNLWKLCGVGPEGDRPRRSDVSEKVLGIALRTLALYLAYSDVGHPDLSKPARWERAARLCLWAWAGQDSAAADCRARNLLEAAFFLPEGLEIADLWNLTSGGKVSKAVLQAKANALYRPERRNHPGLTPYMDLINLVLASSTPPPGRCNRLARAFDRTGEGYFAQLSRDMATHALLPAAT